MNDLSLYGWNEALFQQKQKSNFKDLKHGRVIVTHKTCYEVISEDGVYTCELTGNMLYSREKSEYPCTGDWVIFQEIEEEKGIIMDMLERQKALYRLKAGSISERQAMASHVDKAFMVQSLDEKLNLRRIERFMLQLKSEAIEPVLVLNKTDLGLDKAMLEKKLEYLKIPVFYTSIYHSESIRQLREYIQASETVVFLGLSGVGKSSLINALCGKEIAETSAISTSTGKGRHTSTRREIILMDDSGVLIDTPGIKLFGITADDQDSLSEIMDIDSFEGQCSFSDCQHVNEKGCAVIEAVEAGVIDPGVYKNYLKLRKEAWHYTSSVHEKRKQEKSFAKMVKGVKKNPFNKKY